MPDLTARLPSFLLARARFERFAGGTVPVLLAHPTWNAGERVPLVLWMHGRTASKELDPGRYLRLLRAGIGVCAIDLPGHGERLDRTHQETDNTLDTILEMVAEIDAVVADALAMDGFDGSRLGVGGMSAGGMATLVRMCRPHPFRCASVEAATGSWESQLHRPMFEHRAASEIAARDPMINLEDWTEVPLQAMHARERYEHPEHIELIVFEETGAPYEHAGFGRFAATAKEAQVAFFQRWLVDEPDEGPA
jgi:dienelactone hydrolase